MGLRVAWADHGFALIAKGIIGRFSPGITVDVFDTHRSLLAADKNAPYDVVLLHAQDALNAMDVCDRLRERGHVRAVALCSGCTCFGGIRGAHGVWPETFDAFFEKASIDWRILVLWLEDLERHPRLRDGSLTR